MYFPLFATGVPDTNGKYAAGVVHTGFSEWRRMNVL
jgi:hypothetical protein